MPLLTIIRFLVRNRCRLERERDTHTHTHTHTQKLKLKLIYWPITILDRWKGTYTVPWIPKQVRFSKNRNTWGERERQRQRQREREAGRQAGRQRQSRTNLQTDRESIYQSTSLSVHWKWTRSLPSRTQLYSHHLPTYRSIHSLGIMDPRQTDQPP